MFNSGGSGLLWECSIDGVFLIGADISSVRFPRQRINRMRTLGSRETRLHHSQKNFYDEAMALKEQISDAELDNEPTELITKLRERLENSTFNYWSNSDLVPTGKGSDHDRFRIKLGLTGWPYDDD